MTRYYKVDTRKITYVERWHLSRGPLNLIVSWLNKTLGIPIQVETYIPEPTTFTDRMVDPSQLPVRVLDKLKPGVADCIALGFHDPCYHCIKDSLTPKESGGVFLRHISGEVAANVIYVKFQSRENSLIVLASLLSKEKILFTTNHRREFNPRPGWETERIIGGTARQLWDRHAQRLEKIRSKNPPRKFSTREMYDEYFDCSIRKLFEHNVRRGLWVEMTPEEIAAVRRKFPPPPPTR